MRLSLEEKSSNEILQLVKNLSLQGGEVVEFELLETQVQELGYKAFTDLAQLFFLKMLTPYTEGKYVILRFEKLHLESSFHTAKQGDEKYGVESEFFLINKIDQFSFLYHYQKALEFINIQTKKSVLNLGINKGDEFKVIQKMLSPDEFQAISFTGIDYSKSAIEYAKDLFKNENISLICHDINKLEQLELQKFDLIISIGTLQSSNIEFNATFMSLYQNYLQKGGAIILGFPNCRWIDGEMIYGAKAPNYPFSELSLVLKDIHFCKKYLQQKGYRVIVTGKDYLFLTARKIG